MASALTSAPIHSNKCNSINVHPKLRAPKQGRQRTAILRPQPAPPSSNSKLQVTMGFDLQPSSLAARPAQ
eukprot:577652-Pelagomonas_calceolata.AAC.4